MSFKVKDLALNVVSEASTCSTWTRVSGNSGACAMTAMPMDGRGDRNLSALRAQLRRMVARA
jgi:hypothetical protein